MARLLDVYLHKHLVGFLVQDIHGEVTFQYAENSLVNPTATALSQSLPLRADTFSRKECKGFFGGILPEGEQREIIAQFLASARGTM